MSDCACMWEEIGPMQWAPGCSPDVVLHYCAGESPAAQEGDCPYCGGYIFEIPGEETGEMLLEAAERLEIRSPLVGGAA